MGARGLGRVLGTGSAPACCLVAHLWDWSQEPQVPDAHVKQFRAALTWTRVVNAPGCTKAQAQGEHGVSTGQPRWAGAYERHEALGEGMALGLNGLSLDLA